MSARLLAAAPVLVALATILPAREAQACGGCFTDSESVTQVTGHRMILSLDNEQTTLYDQFSYVGRPESFAWVLPIKGPVEVGLSSEWLFTLLDASSAITIESPGYWCGGGGTPCMVSATATGGGGGMDHEGVEVISHDVVGPYETVQLSSQTPGALQVWLTSHGYAIPADVAPLVDQYVAEGFDFLAMKLLPGATTEAIRPVRVTVPGAQPSLPLRMVAAGTGAYTTLTLFVIAEGRYEPVNFPTFVIEAHEVTWNFDIGASDYVAVREAKLVAHDYAAWQTELAWPIDAGSWSEYVIAEVVADPASTGYGEGDPTLAYEEATADMAALFGSIAPNDAWFTRLRGELAREALANDLMLGAASQTLVGNVLQLESSIGTPDCPPPTPGGGCTTSSTSSGGANDGSGGANGIRVHGEEPQGCACEVAGRPSERPWSLAALVGLGYIAAQRRRRAPGAATHGAHPS